MKQFVVTSERTTLGFGDVALGTLQSKHQAQTATGVRAAQLDAAAKAVGYEFPRVGRAQGLTQPEDIEDVHRKAGVEVLRPIKVIIGSDGRLWADNTHWSLAWMVRKGVMVPLDEVDHYAIDVRGVVAVVHDPPSSLIDASLVTAVDNALRLRSMLLAGFRPHPLSLTLEDLFLTGGYGGIYRSSITA